MLDNDAPPSVKIRQRSNTTICAAEASNSLADMQSEKKRHSKRKKEKKFDKVASDTVLKKMQQMRKEDAL